ASVNGRPAMIPAPVITIAKVRRLNIACLPSPRGRWAYTGPSQWRHIDANGALFAQSGVGKVMVPLLHRCCGRRWCDTSPNVPQYKLYTYRSANAHDGHGCTVSEFSRPYGQLPISRVAADAPRPDAKQGGPT